MTEMHPCRRLKIRISLLLLSLLALSTGGCNWFSSTLITLWTDQPEAAAYIETFNARQDALKVELIYKADLLKELAERKKVPDLVLGRWLNGQETLAYFEPLDDLFNRRGLRREDFYPGLLEKGAQDKRTVMLPVSFNLPALLFRPEHFKETVPNLVIPLDFIREQGTQFNQTAGSRFRRMGFSPLWDRDFLLLHSLLLGVGFREDKDQTLSWNSEAMNLSLARLREWIAVGSQDAIREREFVERHMFIPMVKLVEEGRILFCPTHSGEYFKTIDEHRNEMDFRWIAHENRIVALPDILFAGVPRRARNRSKAREFLRWFFQEPVQKELLRVNRRKRLQWFGIAGGFSSLKAINETEIPQLYPLFIGRIPTADFIQFPGSLPSNWTELKQEVILPWFFESCTRSGAPEDLKAKIRAFRTKSPFPP